MNLAVLAHGAFSIVALAFFGDAVALSRTRAAWWNAGLFLWSLHKTFYWWGKDLSAR